MRLRCPAKLLQPGDVVAGRTVLSVAHDAWEATVTAEFTDGTLRAFPDSATIEADVHRMERVRR